jgi:hypothetical protein
MRGHLHQTGNQRPQVFHFAYFLRLIAAEKSPPKFDASAPRIHGLANTSVCATIRLP